MNEIKEIFDLAQKQYSNQMDDCISFRKRSISIAVGFDIPYVTEDFKKELKKNET